MKKKRNAMDMTSGPLLRNIIVFSIPVILTGLLQCFYNAADLVIVGRFEGSIALAAVSNTGALTNLVVGLCMGIAVGAGVCAAQYIGAREYEKVRKVVHTSVVTSILFGIIVALVGVIFAPNFLRLMDTPEGVMEHSTLYIRIIFCGVPANLLYNYCASILRSSGDTKHPLIFLTISGLVNVGLNVVLVTVVRLGVAGVAIATISSQILSAVMIVAYMARSNGYLKIEFKKLSISRKYLRKMLLIGIPSGIQGSLFSLSNVVIQSSINSFGDIVMAGNGAAGNIEGFIYIAMNSGYQATMTFVGQNVGAKRYDRIPKVLTSSMIVVTGVWVIFAGGALLFARPLLSLYANGDPAVIDAGVARMAIVISLYVICGYMDALCGALRGMGKSFTAMIISLVGACGVRILWINTVFEIFRTQLSVYISYPVTWTLTTLCHFIAFYVIYKKTMKLGFIPERTRLK